MSKLKRFIVRLFKIRVEDLQEESKFIGTPKLKESINKQEVYIQQELKNELSLREVFHSEKTEIPVQQKLINLSKENIPNSDNQLEEEIISDPPIGSELDIENYVVQEETDISNIQFPKITNSNPSIEKFTPANEEKILSVDLFITKENTVHPLSENRYQALLPIDKADIRLGIDFGTTTTAISVKIGDMRPEILQIGLHGETFMPSMVYVKPNKGTLKDRVIIGEEAESFGDQSRIIRSVKRCFGCPGNRCYSQQKGKPQSTYYPFPLCKGNGKIFIDEKISVDPYEIAYLIVEEALRRAVQILRDQYLIDVDHENIKILPGNLGCGALFNLTQRETLMRIASNLGLERIQIENIVEEPILAGFAFSHYSDKPEGRILIYDFGGGTFDVALLEVDRVDNRLRVAVLATAGESWLGGDDIDFQIYQSILNSAATNYGVITEDFEGKLGSIDKNKLFNIARKAKEQLSGNLVFNDSLLAEKIGPINISMTRDEYEVILEKSNLIDRSLQTVERAIKLVYAFENAKGGTILDTQAIIRHRISDSAKNIDRVILVGGVTKTPFIRRKLIEIFGVEKIIEEKIIEPISAVAIGGSYKLDQNHYSISSPPYGFYLKYRCNNHDKFIPIFLPYEYLDFHRYWFTNSSAHYEKEIEIPNEINHVSVMYKKAKEEKYYLIESIGRLTSGSWKFSISIDGTLYYKKNGDVDRPIAHCPTIHPIQEEIRSARSKREKEEYEKRINSRGDLFSDIRSMMNDN